MVIFWDRVLAQARILGRDIDVDAVVRESGVDYTVEGKRFGEEAMVNGFRGIHVARNTIKSSSNLCVALDNASRAEIDAAIGAGDFVTSYIVVLNTIAFRLESELFHEGLEVGRRTEIETCLLALNRIKHNLLDSTIAGDKIVKKAVVSVIGAAVA